MSSMKLKVSKQLKDGICFLGFTGDIDEDFTFDQLVEQTVGKYLIDLNEVEMINSCGIREWINFVEQLGSNCQIVYVNCPQIIVQQINMVDGFLSSNSRVFSFYAPYYNEDKDEEKRILLKADEVKDLKAPVIKDEDGSELEFDAHEKQYFKFLERQGKAAA